MKREPFYDPLMTTHLQQMLFIPLLYEQIEDSEILKHTHTQIKPEPHEKVGL